MSKLALLTGGSRGIGKATAEMLRERGWTVEAPRRAELDMSDTIEAAHYARMFGRFMPDIQALIFCHGSWHSEESQRTRDYSDQLAQRVLAPLILITHLFADSVVMVASTQAFGGRRKTGPYACACAAQVRLIQGLAQSKNGRRYNVVCPGLTDTAMAAQVRASGDCAPDAVAQPVSAVAAAIVGLIESDANGKVLRVVDGVTTEARWSW